MSEAREKAIERATSYYLDRLAEALRSGFEIQQVYAMRELHKLTASSDDELRAEARKRMAPPPDRPVGHEGRRRRYGRRRY